MLKHLNKINIFMNCSGIIINISRSTLNILSKIIFITIIVTDIRKKKIDYSSLSVTNNTSLKSPQNFTRRLKELQITVA